MTTVTHVTPEELLVLPDGKLFELVDGELVEKHASGLTSYLALELGAELRNFVRANRLGYVFGSDCGFRCFPDDAAKVRKPDVSFITGDRIDSNEIGLGWITTSPDLVVEIVSPNDTVSELEGKLDDYRSAGIPAVWVVYPELKSAFVHRPDGSRRRLEQPVEFVGEGPLTGFRCPLADLFPSDPR